MEGQPHLQAGDLNSLSIRFPSVKSTHLHYLFVLFVSPHPRVIFPTDFEREWKEGGRGGRHIDVRHTDVRDDLCWVSSLQPRHVP